MHTVLIFCMKNVWKVLWKQKGKQDPGAANNNEVYRNTWRKNEGFFLQSADYAVALCWKRTGANIPQDKLIFIFSAFNGSSFSQEKECDCK